MHLRCKNNILSTYLLHSKNLHKILHKIINMNSNKMSNITYSLKRKRKKKYTDSIMNESKR